VPSLAQPAARAALLERAARLSPDATPAWGRLTAPQMLVHVTDALRMAFGDVRCAPKHMTLLRRTPVKQLVIYWLPFPKGTPTAPELLARAATSWDDELARLREAVGRFDPAVAPARWPEHPIFGALSGRAWGVLAYRHADHHLRQFGV
jgi:hypothetical protein